MTLSSEQKNQSLKHSVRDGVFYSIMMGFGENFFVAFAIALGARDIELGLLSSLPMAIGSLAQLFSNRLIKLFNSRKKFVVVAALLQTATFIPISLLAWTRTSNPLLFILILCFYWLFILILGPAWTSWMGDLVEENNRGHYFGSRNRICGIVAFLAFLLAGSLLEALHTEDSSPLRSFTWLFAVAFAARLLSTFFLSRQADHPYNARAPQRLNLTAFLVNIRGKPFGVLIFFLWLMNAGVNVAAPFFAPYMLKDLQLSYLHYTLITGTILIVKYLFMPVWGKAADQYGTRKVLTLCAVFMPSMPLLWLLPHNFLTLLLLHIFSGFIWSGFELSAFNFLFDATSREERIMYLAYYNAFNGLMVLGASLFGGLLVRGFPFMGSGYKGVFLISGLMRLLVVLLLVPRLKEIRIVQHISYRKLLFKVLSAQPGRGFIQRPLVFLKAARRKNLERKTRSEYPGS